MTILIRADRLIDGTGAAPIEHPVLVIEGDKIIGVFEGQAPDGLIQAPAETLDYRGGTILPGLIDAHVHLNLPGDGTSLEEAMTEDDGVLVATSAFSAEIALTAGITTVRDVGGARGTIFHLRRALELGHGRGSRIIACGQPITMTGGHAWSWGGETDGADSLRVKVRELSKLGADFIKVMASGGGTLNTISWLPSFRREELAALADEAHRQGRKVTAHCLCATSIEHAVEAGFDHIEHAGFLVDREGRQKFEPSVAEKLARAGVPVTGTLAVGGAMIKTLLGKEKRSAAEQALLDRWRRMFDDSLSQFRNLHEAGVRFVAGSDAGWRFTPFDGVLMEIGLMHQGGLSAMEAIVAATGFSAKVLGVEDKIGTLKAGVAADLVVVGDNPLQDLGCLRHVRLVMQGGKVHVADGHPVMMNRSSRA